MSIAPSVLVRVRVAAATVAALPIFAGTPVASASAEEAAAPAFCSAGFVHAAGAPDPDLFSAAASADVLAEWCEGYDDAGRVHRAGRYRETHPNGRPRVEARYVDGRLDGPILAFDEDGFLFVRGELRDGRWSGALSLLLPNGTAWFDATYVDGRLEGPVLMRHPDGALAAETRYAAGRERGLARSFYPSDVGGGLLSEVRVEDGELVGAHRVFDVEGTILAPLDADHPLFATVPLPEQAPPVSAGNDDAPTPVASIDTP